jgi:hypothetical protein
MDRNRPPPRVDAKYVGLKRGAMPEPGPAHRAGTSSASIA